jgi:hypothetical protein
MAKNPATEFMGKVNLSVTVLLLCCVVLVILGSARKWIELITNFDRREDIAPSPGE